MNQSYDPDYPWFRTEEELQALFDQSWTRYLRSINSSDAPIEAEADAKAQAEGEA